MMNSKKTLALILSVLLLMPVIAGCGGSSDDPTSLKSSSASSGASSVASAGSQTSFDTSKASSGSHATSSEANSSSKESASFVPVSPSSPSSESSSDPEPGEMQPPVTVPAEDRFYAEMTDIQLSRYAGAEGMVLLENNGALPIKKGATVALFGGAQIDFVKGGTGSGDVNSLYTVNLLEGMKNKEAEGKLTLYSPLAEKYQANSSYTPTDAMIKDAVAAASDAVIVISRNSGENVDVSVTKYNLTSAERTLIRKVSEAGFDHVTVLLNIGTVMDTSFIKEYPKIDAVLVCWQPGMEGGNATADVLCGDVCPSGKLVDTMASSYGAYPSSKNFNGSEYAVYSEDIYVGYRYFETFDPEYTKVNYPFGYGLSYTSFSLSSPLVRENEDYIEVRVKVTNTGNVAGKEVVQVYFSAPTGKLGAPGKVLSAFAKTKLLQPGKSEWLVLTFAISDMAMYDDTGKIVKSAYVLEKGDYRIFVGNSVKDAGERGCVFTHHEPEDRVTLQLDGKISPTTLTERLTADGSYEKLDTSGYGIDLAKGKTVLSGCDYLIQNSQSVLSSNGNGTVYGMELSKENALYFLVNAPQAGDYTLTFGIGRTGSGVISSALQVSVNGKTKNVDLTATGGIYTVADGGSTVITLKEGANTVKIAVSSSFSGTFLLSTLTFDDNTGAGITDLRTAKPQSVSIASGENIDFKEVYENPELLERFLDSLTPSEMIHLLCGHAPNVGHGDGSLAGLTAKGVTYLDTSDGPAGLDLAVKQVAWPIETALACSWNTSLLYEVGKKIGEECFTAGVDVWLAPGINIHRDPLGGRNFEYFSEDPLLTGKMSSALTQGVQSVGGVGVMIKHLYANSRESGRVDGNSSISERAARMIYLKAFEICIKEANPWSVMTTYNSTNGIYNSENAALLNGVLREEWGFKGFVCTDWGAHSEQFREIAAGNDAKMSWGYPESCLAAYRCGVLPLENLKASARRLLVAALESGSLYRSLHPVIIVHEINGTTRIKAAELSERSEGIGFEECLDEDGGINPNYCQSGRFISFALDVTKAGVYKMLFRVASENSGAAFKVYLDGELIGNFRWSRGSGGWQNWETRESNLKLNLTEGEHELKFVFATALNMNWFELQET